MEAGWSEQTVEDVVQIASIFALFNRLVDGLGVTGSDEGYKFVGRAIHSGGYAPVVGMLKSRAS